MVGQTFATPVLHSSPLHNHGTANENGTGGDFSALSSLQSIDVGAADHVEEFQKLETATTPVATEISEQLQGTTSLPPSHHGTANENGIVGGDLPALASLQSIDVGAADHVEETFQSLETAPAPVATENVEPSAQLQETTFDIGGAEEVQAAEVYVEVPTDMEVAALEVDLYGQIDGGGGAFDRQTATQLS